MTALPVLPDEVGETIECEAVAFRIGHRIMLALPYRAGFGPSRGRRYRVVVNGIRTGSQLIMAVGHRAMIPVPGDDITEGNVVQVRLRVLAQRPTLRLPGDFTAALAAEGLSADLMESHELNQLVTMIKEADDPDVRCHRIATAVAAVADLTAARARDVHDR